MPLATLNGLQTYYEIHGGEIHGGEIHGGEIHGGGVPLVLIHHDASSSKVWAPFIPTFARSYRVIVYDRRGQGLSAAPQPYAPYRVPTLADDLEHLLAHLGIEQLYLLGYSGGALAALEFALRHEERIEALILVEPNILGFPFTAALSPEAQWALDSVNEALAHLQAGAMENALRVWLSGVYPGKEEKILQGPGGQELRAMNPRIFLDVMQSAIEFTVPESRLRDFQRPALLIGGGSSQVLYQFMIEQLHAWLARSSITWIPGGDHGLVVQRPRLFRSAVMEFLEHPS